MEFHCPLVTHQCVKEPGQHWLRCWLAAWSVLSHCLNQYWLIINCTLSKLHLNQNTQFSFQNSIGKMFSILAMGQWLNTCWLLLLLLLLLLLSTLLYDDVVDAGHGKRLHASYVQFIPLYSQTNTIFDFPKRMVFVMTNYQPPNKFGQMMTNDTPWV